MILINARRRGVIALNILLNKVSFKRFDYVQYYIDIQASLLYNLFSKKQIFIRSNSEEVA